MKSLSVIFLSALCFSQCNVNGGIESNRQEAAVTSNESKIWKTVKMEAAELTLNLPPKFVEASERIEFYDGTVPQKIYHYNWFKQNRATMWM